MIVLLLCCALGLSYAWGMRGTPIGHGSGAMLPGAMLGLFTAAAAETLGIDNAAENAVILAGVGAAAMFPGGEMTYGQTIGLAHRGGALSFWRGQLGLALKGFLWFQCAAAYIMLGLSVFCGNRIAGWEICLVAAGSMLLRSFGIWLLNRPHEPRRGIYPKIYFSITRPEVWGGYLCVSAGLIWYMALRLEWLALCVSLAAGAGAAVGWFFGNMIHRRFKETASGRPFLGRLGRYLEGWKAMECAIGFAGGAGMLGGLWAFYGVFGFEKGAVPAPELPPVLSVGAACAWIAVAVCHFALERRFDKGPIWRPALEKLRTFDFISEKKYLAELETSTEERPGILMRMMYAGEDFLLALVYAWLPLALVFWGSGETAALLALGVPVFLLAKKLFADRSLGFLGGAAAGTAALCTAAAVAASLLLGKELPLWTLAAAYTLYYELLTIWWHYLKKERLDLFRHSGFATAFGSITVIHIWFIIGCAAAAAGLWSFLF